MVKIILMAVIPVVALIAGSMALKGGSALRALTAVAGLLIVTPLAVTGNGLVLAAVSSGMISAGSAWYVQIAAVPLGALLLAFTGYTVFAKIAGEGLDVPLPVVLNKVVAFLATAFAAMLVCAILYLPLASSPLRQVVPATAAPAAIPAAKVMDHAAGITLQSCDGRSVSSEVFNLRQ